MNDDTLRALLFLVCQANVNGHKLYKAAKKFTDAYEHDVEPVRDEHEERHKMQACPIKRNWTADKQRAYGKLLDCVGGRMSPEVICDAAIKLAQACKPEVDKPKAGETYRDIFGNKYVVITVHENFSDGTPLDKSIVVLGRVSNKGEIPLPEAFMIPLEEFRNPRFTKCDRD